MQARARWPSFRRRTNFSLRGENEVNLGYVYYRKESDSEFSLGAMQPEHGQGYAPWGVSAEVWDRRVRVARSQIYNYALYNAPPGTMQHMAVYYFLSAAGSHQTQQQVMAYTHNDSYKPVPGFKTVTGHFHLEFNEMIRDRGTSDFMPTWVSCLSRARHQHRLSCRLSRRLRLRRSRPQALL
jgi:hypothetical protein